MNLWCGVVINSVFIKVSSINGLISDPTLSGFSMVIMRLHKYNNKDLCIFDQN